MLNLDPMVTIIDNGGSNGEDDVEFRRLLRTERFWITLADHVDIPKKYKRLHIIERLFADNYDNLYISWMATLADKSVHCPFHYIGIHETTIERRRDLEEDINADTYRVPQATIDKFRDRATKRITHPIVEVILCQLPKLQITHFL